MNRSLCDKDVRAGDLRMLTAEHEHSLYVVIDVDDAHAHVFMPSNPYHTIMRWMKHAVGNDVLLSRD